MTYKICIYKNNDFITFNRYSAQFRKIFADDPYTLEYYSTGIYVTLFSLLNRRNNRKNIFCNLAHEIYLKCLIVNGEDLLLNLDHLTNILSYV